MALQAELDLDSVMYTLFSEYDSYAIATMIYCFRNCHIIVLSYAFTWLLLPFISIFLSLHLYKPDQCSIRCNESIQNKSLDHIHLQSLYGCSLFNWIRNDLFFSLRNSANYF